MSVTDKLITDIAGQQGAFGRRIMNFEVQPFSFETTKEYLEKRADYLNFTDSGLNRFYKCTGGIPFYINIFARILRPNSLLDDNTVSLEFKEGLHILSSKLTNEWYRLTLQEQHIISSLVDKPLRRVEIAKKLNVTSGSIGKSLNVLLNKALIEVNDKEYYISDKILKYWLKREYNKKGYYPFKNNF